MKSLSDISTPATVTRKLLEADVQEACVKWARARGYWARKFSSISQRSVPDYLFSRLVGDKELAICFACEFKAPGKKPTPAQVDEMKAMYTAGWAVFDCDNIEKFKRSVERIEMRATAATALLQVNQTLVAEFEREFA